jgi:hypothetical protein
LRIIGTTQDARFPGSIMVKVESTDHELIGYALRKNENGDLEGNKIGFMNDGDIGSVYQLREPDFAYLKNQGIFTAYETALAFENSQKIDQAKLSMLRLYIAGDTFDPAWNTYPEKSLMNDARKNLLQLSEIDQERVATEFF